jgi:hypothetical protein
VDDAGFRRLSAELGALTRGQRRRIRSALDRLDEAAKVAAKPLPVGPAAGRARGAIATPHGGAVAVDAPGRGAFGSDLGPSEVGQSGTHASDARPGGAGSTGAGANDAGPRNACAISVGPSGERASGAPPAGAPGSALCGGERPAAGPDFGFFRSKRTASHRGFGYSASPPIPAAGDLAPSAARDAGARRGCQAAGDLDDRRQCHDGDPSRSAGTGTGCRRQHGGHGEATRPSTPAIAPSVPSFARIRLPDAFQRVRDDMLHSRRPGTCRALAASLAIDKTTVWRWRRRIMGTLHAAPLLQTPGSRTRSNGAGASPAAGKRLRESRKGSRLWVNHRNDPLAAPVPHRPRWVDVDRAAASPCPVRSGPSSTSSPSASTRTDAAMRRSCRQGRRRMTACGGEPQVATAWPPAARLARAWRPQPACLGRGSASRARRPTTPTSHRPSGWLPPSNSSSAPFAARGRLISTATPPGSPPALMPRPQDGATTGRRTWPSPL